MRCYHNKAPARCSICQRPDRAESIKEIVRCLRRKPCSASDLARLLNVTKPTVYKRLEYVAKAVKLESRIESYGERGRGPRARVYRLKKVQGPPSGKAT